VGTQPLGAASRETTSQGLGARERVGGGVDRRNAEEKREVQPAGINEMRRPDDVAGHPRELKAVAAGHGKGGEEPEDLPWANLAQRQGKARLVLGGRLNRWSIGECKLIAASDACFSRPQREFEQLDGPRGSKRAPNGDGGHGEGDGGRGDGRTRRSLREESPMGSQSGAEERSGIGCRSSDIGPGSVRRERAQTVQRSEAEKELCLTGDEPDVVLG
jgi:hypothetical protein